MRQIAAGQVFKNFTKKSCLSEISNIQEHIQEVIESESDVIKDIMSKSYLEFKPHIVTWIIQNHSKE